MDYKHFVKSVMQKGKEIDISWKTSQFFSQNMV